MWLHRRRGRDCEQNGRGCELWAVSYELNDCGYGRDRDYDRDCKLQNADAHELNDRGHGYGRDRDHDYDDRDCGHGCMILNVDAHDRCLLTVVCWRYYRMKLVRRQ